MYVSYSLIIPARVLCIFVCFYTFSISFPPDKAMAVLFCCLESKEMEMCCIGASALWALLHNNQRVHTHAYTSPSRALDEFGPLSPSGNKSRSCISHCPFKPDESLQRLSNVANQNFFYPHVIVLVIKLCWSLTSHKMSSSFFFSFLLQG